MRAHLRICVRAHLRICVRVHMHTGAQDVLMLKRYCATYHFILIVVVIVVVSSCLFVPTLYCSW